KDPCLLKQFPASTVPLTPFTKLHTVCVFSALYGEGDRQQHTAGVRSSVRSARHTRGGGPLGRTTLRPTGTRGWGGDEDVLNLPVAVAVAVCGGTPWCDGRRMVTLGGGWDEGCCAAVFLVAPLRLLCYQSASLAAPVTDG
ncbi:hypothetical protein DQ04_02491000, partial [Trypanosoma grayi]|uniref:hypothetical protein n=1 Tax=Trypanosoma grayi TaxID=71804 RepID=UPI0004F4AD05